MMCWYPVLGKVLERILSIFGSHLRALLGLVLLTFWAPFRGAMEITRKSCGNHCKKCATQVKSDQICALYFLSSIFSLSDVLFFISLSLVFSLFLSLSLFLFLFLSLSIYIYIYISLSLSLSLSLYFSLSFFHLLRRTQKCKIDKLIFLWPHLPFYSLHVMFLQVSLLQIDTGFHNQHMEIYICKGWHINKFTVYAA